MRTVGWRAISLVVAVAFSIAGCSGSGAGDSAAQWDTNPDLDGDSFHAGADCDDGNPDVHPGAAEVCDGIDNDCDQTIDVDAVDMTIAWYDGDRDGFGAGVSDSWCEVPKGWVLEGGDCDDTRTDVHPGAPEVCDPKNVDEDCDSVADDNDASASNLGEFYVDADGDGYGVDDATPVIGCDAPTGYAALPGDCDDGRPDVSPATVEVCGDTVDDDCDGSPSCALQGAMSVADADLTLTGSAEGEELGADVEPAGDVDGNGMEDLAVVARVGTFLFAGPTTTSTSASAVAQISNGADFDVSNPLSIGDQDGDGYDDLAVSGASTYVFLGPIAGSLIADVDADATLGIGIGNPSSAGDVSGDGIVDVLLAAPWAGWGTNGEAYVFLGPVTSGNRTKSNADASFAGPEAYDYLGSAVCADGDLDGDGIDEVLLTAPGYDFNKGSAWVFRGPVSGARDLGGADVTVGPGGVTDWFGWQASANGDLDGDGLDDVVIAALPMAGRGEVFVFSASALTASAELDATDADAHIQHAGKYEGYQLGYQLATGLDIDGDAIDDLFVADPSTPEGGTVWGFGGPASGELTVSDAAVALSSAGKDGFASSVAVLPDVTGDGFDDLGVGAPGAYTDAPPGTVYVFAAGP
jgi:hypothetical protein